MKIPTYNNINDIIITGLPFLVSTFIIIFDLFTYQFAIISIVILFISSFIILAKSINEGIFYKKICKLSLILGFTMYYSLPAFYQIILYLLQLDNYLHEFNIEIIIWGIFYLSLYFLLLLICLFLFKKNNSAKSHETRDNKLINEIKIMIFSLIGITIGLIPIIYFTPNIEVGLEEILGSRAVSKPWLQISRFGNAQSGVIVLTSSVMVGSLILLWAITQEKRITIILRILIGFIALLTTGIIYMDQGTRSVFLMVIIPFMSRKILMTWKKNKYHAMFISIVIITILTLALQFQLLYRYQYTRYEIKNYIFKDLLTLGKTSDFFQETLFSISIVPNIHDYFKENIIIEFLLSPIPRFIWESKPASEMIWYYTFYRTGINIDLQGGNILPGIVGQFYMNWGCIGIVIIALLLAYVATRIDNNISIKIIEGNSYKYYLYSSIAVWLFISYRLLSPGFLYPIICVAVIIFASGRQKDRKTLIKRWRTVC